jgi:hypothetical protein
VSGQQPDPGFGFTAVQEAAVQMHELFVTWRKAGFSEKQALHLMSQLMNTSLTQGQTPCPHCGKRPGD